MTSPSRDQSVKLDGGKIRLELLPPHAINAMGAVLTYGAAKYEAKSWRTVDPDRYEGALLRHMMAHMTGERLDPESGMPHLWHVLCNAAFLVELDREKDLHVLESHIQQRMATS